MFGGKTADITIKNFTIKAEFFGQSTLAKSKYQGF
jgi:hypothetical protein